jgi:hypothetical protein
MYRVTSAQLGCGGFDTASDSTNWQLYVEGVEQAILVGPSGSYIEFYGRGTDTAETDTRQYYLMNGSSAGKRMTSQTVSANSSTVVSRSISQTFVKKERINFVEDIFNGDRRKLLRPFDNERPSGTTMTFNLSEVDFATLDSSMELRFQGYSAGDHSVEVILNGETLAPATGADLETLRRAIRFQPRFLGRREHHQIPGDRYALRLSLVRYDGDNFQSSLRCSKQPIELPHCELPAAQVAASVRRTFAFSILRETGTRS